MLSLFDDLLSAPSKAMISAYWEAIDQFQDSGMEMHEAVTQFMMDVRMGLARGPTAITRFIDQLEAFTASTNGSQSSK